MHTDSIQNTIPDPIDESQPSSSPQQYITSEGERIKHPVKVSSLTDEEFDNLLKSIPQKQSTIIVPTVKSTTDKHLRKKLLSSLQQYHTKRLKRHTQIFLLQKETRHKANHIFNIDGHKESIDSRLQGSNSSIWSQSLTNELGRLAQGTNKIKGNDCLDSIRRDEFPLNKKVTYANMVCDFRPLKQEKYRVRLTVGGDKLDYSNDATSPAASLVETKLLFNSVISDSARGARFMTLDIKDFFLQTTMKECEYMKIHERYFSQELRDKYNLTNKIVSDKFVYCRIKKRHV